MRDAHITIDRSGLFDPQPLRTFTVYRDPAHDLQTIDVKAHIANQLESGALAFVTLKGGLPFVTHSFAPGMWSDFTGSVPSDDDVRSIKAFSEREHAITRMLEHDAKGTRQ